jgi:hypothetical protein
MPFLFLINFIDFSGNSEKTGTNLKPVLAVIHIHTVQNHKRDRWNGGIDADAKGGGKVVSCFIS